jgi:hypothetical protein
VHGKNHLALSSQFTIINAQFPLNFQMKNQPDHVSEEPEGRRGQSIIYLDERRNTGSGTLRPPSHAPANEILTEFETGFIGALELINVNFRNLFIQYSNIIKSPGFDLFRYALFLAWKKEGQSKFTQEEAEMYKNYEIVVNKWEEQINALSSQITVWHNKLFGLSRDLNKDIIQNGGELKSKVEKYLNSLRDKSFSAMNWRITAENLELVEKYTAANLKEAQ